jgi:hypothetical protein
LTALDAYRRTGADPPFGDPLAAHGVRFEGYYWRLTDPGAGRVTVALCGACRGAAGPWALVVLAAEPGGFVRSAIVPDVEPDPARLGVRAGDALVASAERLRVDLGEDARLDAAFARVREWPRRAFGALGPAHAVPGLPQYWHPHVLGAAVEGHAELGAERVPLTGALAYAEKNWGPAFSDHWWWGQAFAGPDACVSFAGGRLWAGAPTAVVVRLGDELLRLATPLARTSVSVRDDVWRVRARSPRHAVEIEGEGRGAPTILPVPVVDERRVEQRSRQFLTGRLHVTVRRGRRLLFDGESMLAGLERPAWA